MCGIAGYWDLSKNEPACDILESIHGMTECLRDRGPDSGGIWFDKGARLAFGHRRLAIRDLSPLGAQPMQTPNGRFILCYNGEIYNTDEICVRLREKGVYPQGTSDTEALLLALATLGLEETLNLVLGMFAFAFWDRDEKKLWIARDRFGVKPLFWTREDCKRFLFASGVDPFYFAKGWQPEIDMDAIALYLRFGYIPAPYSVWKNTHCLPQGHYLEVAEKGEKLVRYYDALAIAKNGISHPLPDNGDFEKEAVDGLDSLLTDAIKRRMVSDVPIGAFLSGGIDSSTVVAIMQKCASKPVRTFSIGFEESEYNEAPYAEAVAKWLHADHTTLYLPAKAAWEIIPDIPQIYDQPFGDASAVPTTLLSRLTRQYVTTALSGDGGDEFFAGYARYEMCLKHAPEFSGKTALKNFLAMSLKALPARMWDNLAALIPASLRPRSAGSRIHNFADLKLQGAFDKFYQRYYMQYWWHPDTILKKGRLLATAADNQAICSSLDVRLGIMQFIDTQLYLADDILTKVDRASMSCSLEARTPLLDHRIFAYAWTIPMEWRQKNGHGKYILRKLLERYVPAKLIDRPKMGFGIPIGQWICGPLKEWSEDLLSEANLENTGICRSKPIRAAWERHKSGASNWEYHLWVLLMLLAWLRRKNPAIYILSNLANNQTNINNPTNIIDNTDYYALQIW